MDFALIDRSALFQVIRRNVSGVWVASTSWAIYGRVMSLPNIQTIGTVIGFTDKLQTLKKLTPYTEALFLRLSQEREDMPPPPPPPPPEPGHPPNPCPQCWNLSPANITLVTNPSVVRTAFSVYAATYSVAQALHNLLECSSTACKWEPGSKVYPWKVMLSGIAHTVKNVKSSVSTNE